MKEKEDDDFNVQEVSDSIEVLEASRELVSQIYKNIKDLKDSIKEVN